jgi:coenzyme F420-dependent glucose-6-phosphate dehydrogenase
MSGPIGQELAIPSHYEAVATLLTADQVAETVICGPDAELHIEKIREYEQAGFTHVWVHQVGPDQDSFFRFYSERILPEL